MIVTDSNLHRFFSKVDYPDNDKACWIWTGSLNKIRGAYGVLNKNTYGTLRAHRYSYWIFKGPFKSTSHILHKCDNPSCVNPEHLFLGNHKINMLDRTLKNRSFRHIGELNGRSKLSENDSIKIRRLYETGKFYQKDLAKKFNVVQTQISKVILHKAWK